MEEQNKIVTVVEIDSQQAQQELIKLNSTVSNTTKTLEERIEAKNKAVEIQNQLAAKTIKSLEDNVKSLQGVIGKEKEYEKAVSKLSSEKLKALKQSEQSVVQLDKLGAANDKVKAKTEAQEGAIKSLRVQLREAKADHGLLAQQYGETSTEAINAAKAVAELQDQISFNSDLVESFNPDQKFKALGAATEIAGTAIQGVTSGMALFGETGEATEKVLLKVQAAMSFSQALGQLSNLGDQYKIFKSTIVGAYLSITTAKAAETVATEANTASENKSTLSKAKSIVVTAAQTTATTIATAAQWVWNAAVMANPIVALVVALAAAAAGIYYFTKMLIDSSEANDQAALGTEKLSKELDKESITLYKTGQSIREKNKQTLAMAKANGESSESIRKLERKLIDEQIATDKASTITARNTFIQERNNLAKLKAADASDEVIKAREAEVDVAYKIFQRENKQLDASYKERAQLVKDQEVEIAAEKNEARKKSEEDSKKAAAAARKKAQEDAKKAEEEARKALELKKRQKAAEIALAETEVAKTKAKDPKADTLQAEKDILNQKAELELMTEQLLSDEKLAILSKYNEQKLELDLKREEEELAQRNRGIENEIALDELRIERKKTNDSYSLEDSNRLLEQELALLDKKKEYETSNTDLTEKEKQAIIIAYNTQAKQIEKDHDEAIKASKAELNNQILNGLAETFGIQKEVAVAQMIMAAPQAIGNSYKEAAKVYPFPLSAAMGTLGAAATVVPIVKGLADIKKTRFPGRSKGNSSAGGTIASPTGSSVASVAVGDLAANNAVRLGIDPSIKSSATSDAANSVLGGTAGNVTFSEGKYSDFKNQVQFKEQKTSI